MFETNTFGVMAVKRAIAPHMRERGSGTIINVTSSVGIAPMPFETYEETHPFAEAIRRATLAKSMPPWFADPNVGKFPMTHH